MGASMKQTDIADYAARQSIGIQDMCEQLFDIISRSLPEATAKLYHGSPVWFVDNNPIVGYDATAEHVNILFWSGQSFTTPGLVAAGKFKAAGYQYATVEDIDEMTLEYWLAESLQTQWNYRDLRKNNGLLVSLTNV